MENRAGILYNDHRRPIERDVALLGSAFVLGTKCHGSQSCHSYLLLLLWADRLKFGKKKRLFFTVVSTVIRKRS